MANPLIIGAVIGALYQIIGGLVGRILLALGLSYLTFKGVDTLVQWTINELKNAMAMFPAEALAFLAYLWVDKAISMMLSAYSTALLLRLDPTGVYTMLTFKK